MTDGQAEGGEKGLSSPLGAIYIFYRNCARTSCCHGVNVPFLLFKTEEEV